MTLIAEPMSLDHVLHVLPPSSGARLRELGRRGVVIECLMANPGGVTPARTWLVGWVGARHVRTTEHPWIAPGLVNELVALTEPLLS